MKFRLYGNKSLRTNEEKIRKNHDTSVTAKFFVNQSYPKYRDCLHSTTYVQLCTRLNVGPLALHRDLSTEQKFPSPSQIPLVDSQTPVKSSPPSRKPSPLAPLLNNSNIYMTVHVNSFPYLISPNDTLRLPFHLPDASLGSILRMTRVSRIGVRDYTLQGHPFIDENAFSLKMRVIEHTKMPFVVTKKTKQRQRRTRHLFNKQNYTVLK